jgi:hypothetical protein
LKGGPQGHLHAKRVEGYTHVRSLFGCHSDVELRVGPKAVVDRSSHELKPKLATQLRQAIQQRGRVGASGACAQNLRLRCNQAAGLDGAADPCNDHGRAPD